MNWKHYLLLFLMATFFALISLIAHQHETVWLDSFASNLSSGFLGSLLTAWLIDRSLSRVRDAEIKKVRDIVLSQLRPILLRHLILITVVWRNFDPGL